MSHPRGGLVNRYFAGLSPTIIPLLVCLVTLLGGLPLAAVHAPASAATPASSATSSITPPAHPANPLAFRANAPNVTGTFYANNSNVAPFTNKTAWCGNNLFFTFQCLAQRQDPSLLHLSNGKLAVAFGLVTPVNSSPCYGANNSTYARVGFEVSPDNGTTFGAIQYVTGSSSSTCPYFQELEPSFGTSANGTVYGVFVDANATPTNLTTFGPPLMGYYVRPSDALAFVQSPTGAAFSPAKIILAGGNIARPQIAVYGKTIYVAFENISNGTTNLPGMSIINPPVASEFMYSADAGATWHGPYTLPGENATNFDTSLSPSVEVTPTGTVVVAYATNRTCIAYCAGAFAINEQFGEQIVVSTSSSNGTRWSTPTPVSPALQAEPAFPGGSSGYNGPFLYSLFEYAPNTALLIDPASGNWYVAWDAAYNLSYTGFAFYDYTHAALFAGVSTNGGVSWASSMVSPPLSTDPNLLMEAYFNPALGVSGGTVYLTYTYNIYGFGSSCGPLLTNQYNFRYTQKVSTSLNGVTWSGPIDVSVGAAFSYGNYNNQGYHASVAFDGSGSPIMAYVLENGESLFIPGFSQSVTPVPLVVARPYIGSAAVVTFVANGLPGGAHWGFSVGGNLFSNLLGPAVNVTNFPKNSTEIVAFQNASIGGGYRTEFLPGLTGSAALSFAANGTYVFNLTKYYGFDLSISPSNPLFFFIDFYNGVANWAFNHAWQAYVYPNGTNFTIQVQESGCPFPWYLPAGLSFTLNTLFSFPIYYEYQSALPVTHWSGSGSGNYTGGGAWANITMNGPVNETMYMQPLGSYPVDFVPQGLPSTSTYQFTLDGTMHSAAGNVSVTVPGLKTGAHFLTAVSATSTVAGWAYYGHARTGSPVLVPNTPEVDLDFALVNTSSTPGPVSFHATGLTPGTVWSLGFNGTTYSSATPWINVTVRNGTYPLAGFPAISSNGTATYAPLGLPSTLAVSTGKSYDVGFSPTFEVSVVSGIGGTVAPAGSSFWLAPGSLTSFTATPLVGYSFGGWRGIGTGSYTGSNLTAHVTANGPIVESANFVPLPLNRFNLNITETGLPAGTLWSAVVGGNGYSSSGTTITVPNAYSCGLSGPLGMYTLNVPFVYLNGTPGTRYVPTPYPGTVCGGTSVAIVFTTQYYMTLGATPGGGVSAAVGATITSNSIWVNSGQVVDLQAQPSAGYVFIAWQGTGPGNYSGSVAVTSFTMLGPVSELGVFAPAPPSGGPTYYVDFHETTALPAGTTWTLSFAGGTYSSNSAWINVTGVSPGTHALSVPIVFGPTGYVRFTPISPPANVAVSGNNSAGVPISFGTDYWVKIIVAAGSGTVTPGTGWVSAGSMISLTAVPASGSTFLGWSGSGPGAYTGVIGTQSVTVNAPIEELATFALLPPIVTTSTPLFQNPVVWAGLGVAGLVVGLAVGVLLGRRRTPPTVMLTPATASSSGPSTSPTPSSWMEDPPSSGGGSQ